MEHDVSAPETDQEWKYELVVRKKIYDEAKEKFDDVLKSAVVRGESYSLLGSLLGQSNAAVRLRATRSGWDTDRRIPRKPRKPREQ